MSFGYLWPQLYLAEAHWRAHRKTACFGLCCSLSVFPRFLSCLLWIWGDRRPHHTSPRSRAIACGKLPQDHYIVTLSTLTRKTLTLHGLYQKCAWLFSRSSSSSRSFSLALSLTFSTRRRCSTVSFHVAIGVRWKCIIRRLFPDNLSSLVEEIASLQ